MDQNWLRLSPLVTAHRKWKDIPQQRRVPTPHIFSSNLFDSYSWLRAWGTRAGAVWVLWNLRSSGVLPSELNDPSRSSLHKLYSHIISSWLPTYLISARAKTSRQNQRSYFYFLPSLRSGSHYLAANARSFIKTIFLLSSSFPDLFGRFQGKIWKAIPAGKIK